MDFEFIFGDSRESKPYTNLFLQSTFLAPVEVMEIDSCNPWFTIENTSNGTIAPKTTNNPVGRISFSCGDSENFWQCADLWVNDRVSLQPEDCGSQAHATSLNDGDEVSGRSEQDVISYVMV